MCFGGLHARGRAGWPGLGAVHGAATLTTCRGRAAMPWHEPAAGNEGQLVPQPHNGGGGGRGGDVAGGLHRGSCPAGQEGQQCQQWLQLEPEPLEVAGEQGYAGFMAYLMVCLWFGWGSRRRCPAEPSPALPCTSSPCSASWYRQGGGSQMDFALRGGARQGSPWHRCRVCPLPGSSTAPSLFIQAVTQQGPRGGTESCSVRSGPAPVLLWC